MTRLILKCLFVFVMISGSANAVENTLVEKAQNGDANAQFRLGFMYATGDGVAKDSAEAVKWFRLSAEQGNAPAQSNLGAMYAEGEGVPKDAIESLAWYNIAAAAGEDSHVFYRDGLERRLGAAATLLAQQRSKQILKEIDEAKRGLSSIAPKN